MSSSSIAVCEFFVSRPTRARVSTTNEGEEWGRTLLEDGRHPQERPVEVLLHARLLDGLLEPWARVLSCTVVSPPLSSLIETTTWLPI